MISTKLWLCGLLGFIGIQGAGGFLMFVVTECVFNSTELKDIQYISSDYFNRQELARWDSRVGMFVGYTEFGVKQAEHWNNDPRLMAGMRAERERRCKHNTGVYYSNILDKTVKPYVRLASVTPPGGRRTAMLRCTAYSFYPKLIIVTWLRDGEEITSDVTSTDLLPDGDWYYEYHSFLEYTPRSGEKITCMVEHPSLWEPLMVDWDDSMPEADKNRIAIGASGLVLGLVLFLTGLAYYRWKKRGRVLVPTTNEDL